MSIRASFSWAVLPVASWLVSAASLCGQATPNELSLKIRAEETRVSRGKPVKVDIELINNGTRDLLVLRRLLSPQGDGASLEFQVLDAAGRESPRAMSVADRYGATDLPLAVAVLKAWIALAPRYTYSVTTDITQSDFEFLGQPGVYRITARYRSKGVEGQVSLWHMTNVKPEDIKNLPFASWGGEIVSNPIIVRIYDRARGRQPKKKTQ